MCILYYRAGEVCAASQQVTVAAVQPASHHRPSFGGSPPSKATDFDAAHRLIYVGGRRPPSPRPPPLPLPTAGPGPLLVSTTAGYMIGSHSNPLVGTMRQTGPTATAAPNAASLPRRLLTDAEYMHRFRFLFTRTFAQRTYIVLFA